MGARAGAAGEPRLDVRTSDALEADDVMFSFARAEQERGGRALLLTGDRDLYGAVSERVAVLELRKGGESGELGPAEVRERYGVEPEQVPDFIALRGDPSDGLPGAPGIGAKTAAELLRALRLARGAARRRKRRSSTRSRATTTMRPRAAAALRENDELLRTFKRDRDAAADRRRAPARRRDGLRGRRGAAREAGHAPPGRAHLRELALRA